MFITGRFFPKYKKKRSRKKHNSQFRLGNQQREIEAK